MTLHVGDVLTFDYNGTTGSDGSVQTVDLPIGRYLIECWGAQGGDGEIAGGKGGYAAGEIELATSTTVYVYVGGRRTVISGASGYNGGGSAVSAASYWTGTGGGASDVRIGGTTLYDRIIVGGGGGGSGGWLSPTPGVGGGLSGTAGVGDGISGTGGTQTAGGVYGGGFGTGGGGTGLARGGGGGGWFGGGGGQWAYGAGGGGSSYIGGEQVVGEVSFPRIPVVNGVTMSGQRSGYGQVKITVLALAGETTRMRSFVMIVG